MCPQNDGMVTLYGTHAWLKNAYALKFKGFKVSLLIIDTLVSIIYTPNYILLNQTTIYQGYDVLQIMPLYWFFGPSNVIDSLHYHS